MEYTVRKTKALLPLTHDWDAAPWTDAQPLNIDAFHEASSDHRPVTQARLLYDAAGIGVIFRVKDRYVRCVSSAYQDPVSLDSCVEFFVEPVAGAGYFNFEFNCCGTLLLYHILDATRKGTGFVDYQRVNAAHAEMVSVRHSLSGIIDPEIESPTVWTLSAYIPFSLFEAYVGTVSLASGTMWPANLFKCGDETSHPHWAAWCPINDELNFHQPKFFGTLRLG